MLLEKGKPWETRGRKARGPKPSYHFWDGPAAEGKSHNYHQARTRKKDLLEEQFFIRKWVSGAGYRVPKEREISEDL